MLSDYKDKDLISIQSSRTKGGLDTICALARLFDVSVCFQDFGKPHFFVVENLSNEEREVLKELIHELTT